MNRKKDSGVVIKTLHIQTQGRPPCSSLASAALLHGVVLWAVWLCEYPFDCELKIEIDVETNTRRH
jgi:hypothetical protein